MTKSKKFILFFFAIFIFIFCKNGKAQGNWIALTNNAPHGNAGVMLLLTDGSVIAVTDSLAPGAGNYWDKLTPDNTGSYVNGTWTTIAPMHYSRYALSSQVLQDGRVYIAGAEVGTGAAKAEIYNPVTNAWTTIVNPQNLRFEEANSMLLPDGKLLQALTNWDYPTSCYIFDPLTETFSLSDSSHLGSTVEASWVLLPDNSILMVDYASTITERYIPSLNIWKADAPVPANAEFYGNSVEMGAGFMLPDGRAFILGASGHTAFYTPSGDTANGTWVVGPDIPDTLGTLDAPASMMIDGKILFAASPLPYPQNNYYPFNPPTYFYEFDYLTNAFSRTTAPGGLDSLNQASEISHLLNLPDGTVLYSQDSSAAYYVYTPSGTPVVSGKPTINSIIQNNCNLFSLTGTLFNGISQGAAFGDDWQMATNYPIVRLSTGNNVYYARTYNWNRTGIQTGTLADTTQFTLPVNVPSGSYSLAVIANGISSDTTTFQYTACTVGVNDNSNNNTVTVSPNPFSSYTTIAFNTEQNGTVIIVVDILGEEIIKSTIKGNEYLLDMSNYARGIYFVEIIYSDKNSISYSINKKIVVQ